MRKETQEIIELMLNKFGKHRSFETEHFIYWVEHESFTYDGNTVTRDEFKYIKQYAAYNGTLPNVERAKRLLTPEQKENLIQDINNQYHRDYRHPEIDTGTRSYEKMLRYSKTYDSLEYYSCDTAVKSQSKPGTSNRVLVMFKKNKIFSVTNKGYVRIYGNKWLSLKNVARFTNMNGNIGEDIVKILLKSMIGKDWILNLEMSYSFMISNKSARQADSLEQAVDIECGAKPAKIIKKAFGDDINSILTLYSLVEPNKIHDITNFLKKHWAPLMGILNSAYGRGYSLLFYYFLCKDNRCEWQVMSDYFKMLQENGKKVNLKITSYSTLKRNHDELSRQILLKTSNKGGRLNIAKHYPEIKSLPNLQVEKIKTVKRLNQESVSLRHCVHTYRTRINKGECAIYSLFYEGSTYTLQLNAEKKKKSGEALNFSESIEGVYGDDELYDFDFKIRQLRGKFNCLPPESMKYVLERMCEENNLSPLSDANVYFHDNKDKRKVVQIGDGILDRIDVYGNILRIYEGEEPANVEMVMEEMPF